MRPKIDTVVVFVMIDGYSKLISKLWETGITPIDTQSNIIVSHILMLMIGNVLPMLH